MVHEKRAADGARRGSSKRIRLSDVDGDESSRSTILSIVSESDASDIDVTDPDDNGDLDEDEQRRREESADDDAVIQENRGPSRTRMENHAADNGIIEEVSCRNFMCHASLTVKLGPLINFIIGHNGSGKSAVLTALTLCLGGKASSTNRGQALKDFIKEGQDQATLAVKLKNQGGSAYKPDKFGPSLTVERSFTRNGTSSWKVKTSSGKIELTKKSDVDEVAEYFGLQLDNPMNVLTQDMARQFLSESSASDKYKFFQKGTNLEQLDNDYRVIDDNLQASKVYTIDMGERVDYLKRKWEEARHASERVSGLTKIRLELRDTTHQIAWIQVESEEQKLENIQQQIQASEEKIQQRQAEFEDITEQFDSVFRRLEAAKATEDKIREELRPLEEDKNELNAKFREGRAELESALQDQKEVHGKLQTQRNGIQRLEERIKEEQRKIDNGGEGSRQIYARIQEKKEMLVTEKQKLPSLERDQETLKFELEESKEVESQAERLKMNRQSKVDSHKAKIQQLSNNQGRTKVAKNVQALLDAIDRERRFRVKPKGPVWKHVHLQDMKWSSILERYLGGTLDGFCVTSQSDADVLRELLPRFNCQNLRVYVSPAAPLDLSRSEPRKDILTVLRVLRIEDDLVKNTLIINHSIEQTALIWPRAEASKANTASTAGVMSILSSTGQAEHQRGSGLIHTARVVDGKLHQNTSPIQAWDRETRMRADFQEQLRYENNLLQGAIDDLVQAETSLRDAHRQRDNRAKAHSIAIKNAKDKRTQISRIEDEITQLQEDLDEATPQGGVLEALENDRGKENAELESLEQTYMTLVNTIDQLHASQRELKREQTSMDQNIKVIRQKLTKAQDLVSRTDRDQQTALHAKIQAERLIIHAKAEKEGLENQITAQRDTVRQFIDKASEIWERVSIPEGSTLNGLQTKRNRLKEDIAKAQKEMGGSEEELRAKVAETKKLYDNACEMAEDFDTLMDAMRSAVDMRKQRWEKFRELIAMRAKSSFVDLLLEREFRGSLNISHEDKALDIHIEPDLTRRSNKGRQTKTLSGGEKSFSTICLLLALWDAMGSPIRCLDEFDVFMDNVNRDVSVRLMIEAARKQLGRQFILITPQSMANVPTGTDIKIHKMKDPERGQTALPFTVVAR